VTLHAITCKVVDASKRSGEKLHTRDDLPNQKIFKFDGKSDIQQKHQGKHIQSRRCQPGAAGGGKRHSSRSCTAQRTEGTAEGEEEQWIRESTF